MDHVAKSRATEPQTLLVFCASLFQLDLFGRWRPALATRGWSLAVVTNRLSVWLYACARGIACERMRSAPATSPHPDLSPADTPEFIQNIITLDAARAFQNSLWVALHNISTRSPVGAVCQWNGLNIDGQTVTVYARAKRLPTIFIELGNVAQMLFADPEGVLASSRVANHPEILDALAVTDEEILAWRVAYLEQGQRSSVPPQALILRRWNWWFLLDWLAAIVLRIPQQRQLEFISRIIAKLRISFGRSEPAIKPPEPYVFLPLQVRSDVNLILFSPHDNLDALDVAGRYAREHGLLLVVKPHPAETDFRQLNTIRTRCVSRGHLLTSYNTTKLVLEAECVITINSTVGLESLLLGTPVWILGRSLYGHFTRRQAYAFVMRYLQDFRAFGNEPASLEFIDRLLALIEAQRHDRHLLTPSSSPRLVSRAL